MTDRNDQIDAFFMKLATWVKGVFGNQNTASELYCSNSPSAIKDEANEYVYGVYADALHEKIKAKTA